MKKYFYLLLFLIGTWHSFSQDMPEQFPYISPLKSIFTSFEPEEKDAIKAMIYIFDRDTIFNKSFERNKNTVTITQYFKKKRFVKTINDYDKGLLVKTSSYNNEGLEKFIIYKYDSSKNLIERRPTKVIYDKAKGTSTEVRDNFRGYEYDKSNRIKDFTIDEKDVKHVIAEYQYDSGNKLIVKEELQWKETYDYKNDLLVKKSRFFKPDNSLYHTTEYAFNDDGLMTNYSDEYSSEVYSYENKKVKTFIYTHKKSASVQEATLFYENELLSKVEINATGVIGHFIFAFKSDYLAFSWKKNEPNKLRLAFFYDKQKNVSEIKYYVNDTYAYSKRFVYTYI